jgi:hypothetical protein
MVAVRARFDGETIVVPKALRGAPASDVIILIPARKVAESMKAWHKAQEAAFAKVWDNDEDAIYDAL